MGHPPIAEPTSTGWYTTTHPIGGEPLVPLRVGQTKIATLSFVVAGRPGSYRLRLDNALFTDIAGYPGAMTEGTTLEITVEP